MARIDMITVFVIALAVVVALAWAVFLVERPAFLETMIEAELVEFRRLNRELGMLAARGEIDPTSDFFRYHDAITKQMGRASSCDVPGLLTLFLTRHDQADSEFVALARRAAHEADTTYRRHAHIRRSVAYAMIRVFRYRSTVLWLILTALWLAVLALAPGALLYRLLDATVVRVIGQLESWPPRGAHAAGMAP
jgi:hypothetical protein